MDIGRIGAIISRPDRRPARVDTGNVLMQDKLQNINGPLNTSHRDMYL